MAEAVREAGRATGNAQLRYTQIPPIHVEEDKDKTSVNPELTAHLQATGLSESAAKHCALALCAFTQQNMPVLAADPGALEGLLGRRPTSFSRWLDQAPRLVMAQRAAAIGRAAAAAGAAHASDAA